MRPLRTLWPWGRAEKRLALAVIDRVGLLDKALARADTLSGGQQQRVGIARALVQSPRLLLADEPVASLDPATADDVMRLLHDICTTDRLTAVVSLHQVHLARRHADRIVGPPRRRGRLRGHARRPHRRRRGRPLRRPPSGPSHRRPRTARPCDDPCTGHRPGRLTRPPNPSAPNSTPRSPSTPFRGHAMTTRRQFHRLVLQSTLIAGAAALPFIAHAQTRDPARCAWPCCPTRTPPA
jgi:hypothetical protein